MRLKLLWKLLRAKNYIVLIDNIEEFSISANFTPDCLELDAVDEFAHDIMDDSEEPHILNNLN